MNQKEMVEKFLCPGCVIGHGTRCGKYKSRGQTDGGGCKGHVLGTRSMDSGLFALGMPKGFNRPPITWDEDQPTQGHSMEIYLYPRGTPVVPSNPLFCVPVWKLVQDGFLFVRVAMPRVAGWIIEVIEGGDPADYPNAIDVGPHYEEYD